MIGHATDHTMSPLAVQLVVTGHDQLHDLMTGRMTGLPSHIKRCTIKHQDQYHFFQVPEHVPPLNPGTHPVLAPFPLSLLWYLR